MAVWLHLLLPCSPWLHHGSTTIALLAMALLTRCATRSSTRRRCSPPSCPRRRSPSPSVPRKTARSSPSGSASSIGSPASAASPSRPASDPTPSGGAQRERRPPHAPPHGAARARAVCESGGVIAAGFVLITARCGAPIHLVPCLLCLSLSANPLRARARG